MKKKYSKPLILLENFVLQDSIAASCAVSIKEGKNNPDVDDSLEAQLLGWAGMGYFTTDCDKQYKGEEDASDGICYFTAANNVFSS